MITIRMPKEDLELVLATLEADENQNKQGRNAMFDGKGYCCLGAMQCAKTGGFVEMASDGKFMLEPSMEWLNSVGWQFLDADGEESADPYLPSLSHRATYANDYLRASFKQIAAAIRQCSEGY